jgi:hypothetical protein
LRGGQQLVLAQRRLDRLVHRYGWQAAFAAVDTAITPCMEHPPADPQRRQLWDARLAQLIPHARDFTMHRRSLWAVRG